MLLNDLYHFSSVTPDPEGKGHVVVATLNAKHPIFEGHFPGSPVLPGVCHMQMVVDAAAAVLGRDLSVSEGIDLKFTAVVDPREGDQLLINLQIQPREEDKVRIESITTFNGEVCFKFKGVLH